VTQRRPSQLGFTIVEAAVGMAILSLVMLAMAGTFLVGYRAVSKETNAISADTAVSHAALSLTRDINSAAAIPIGTINSSKTLTLTYGSPSVTVVYSIDSSNELIRTAGGVARVAARGMTSVVISASGCYATLTLQPSASGATAVTLQVSNRHGGCF